MHPLIRLLYFNNHFPEKDHVIVNMFKIEYHRVCDQLVALWCYGTIETPVPVSTFNDKEASRAKVSVENGRNLKIQ